jgi:hypothetical protein
MPLGGRSPAESPAGTSVHLPDRREAGDRRRLTMDTGCIARRAPTQTRLAAALCEVMARRTSPAVRPRPAGRCDPDYAVIASWWPKM